MVGEWLAYCMLVELARCQFFILNMITGKEYKAQHPLSHWCSAGWTLTQDLLVAAGVGEEVLPHQLLIIDLLDLSESVARSPLPMVGLDQADKGLGLAVDKSYVCTASWHGSEDDTILVWVYDTLAARSWSFRVRLPFPFDPESMGAAVILDAKGHKIDLVTCGLQERTDDMARLSLCTRTLTFEGTLLDLSERKVEVDVVGTFWDHDIHPIRLVPRGIGSHDCVVLDISVGFDLRYSMPIGIDTESWWLGACRKPPRSMLLWKEMAFNWGQDGHLSIGRKPHCPGIQPVSTYKTGASMPDPLHPANEDFMLLDVNESFWSARTTDSIEVYTFDALVIGSNGLVWQSTEDRFQPDRRHVVPCSYAEDGSPICPSISSLNLGS